MLDSLGEFNLERQRKIEAIKNKLAGPKKGGEISLETSKVRDYLWEILY